MRPYIKRHYIMRPTNSWTLLGCPAHALRAAPLLKARTAPRRAAAMSGKAMDRELTDDSAVRPRCRGSAVDAGGDLI